MSGASTWYSGSPAFSRRRTSASIAPLGAFTSNAGRVQAGRSRTHGGESHSWDRPTSSPPAPRGETISVPLASKETTCRIQSVPVISHANPGLRCRSPWGVDGILPGAARRGE